MIDYNGGMYLPVRYIGWWLVLLGLVVLPAQAQRSGQQPAVFEGLEVEEHLGERVPTDLVFRNSRGEDVTLGDYLGRDKPVLLHFVYHDCPMLCNLLLDGVTNTLTEMEWTPGAQFDVVTVSFNAAETPDQAARQKQRYLDLLGRPEAADGWHFLTGDEASIQGLTQAVGFKFRWVEESQQFAHPALLLFLSPDGTVTRYLYGLEFPARDVRAALVEASNGTVGTTVDRFLMFCLQYDPNANSYVADAQNLMKLGGLLTVLALVTTLFIFWRREKRTQNARAFVAEQLSH